jgi:hypothetical protein
MQMVHIASVTILISRSSMGISYTGCPSLVRLASYRAAELNVALFCVTSWNFLLFLVCIFQFDHLLWVGILMCLFPSVYWRPVTILDVTSYWWISVLPTGELQFCFLAISFINLLELSWYFPTMTIYVTCICIYLELLSMFNNCD